MQCAQVLMVASSACLFFHFSAWSETVSNQAALKRGSLIEIQIYHDVRMRKGTGVAAHTVYPAYIDNRLVLPQGTEVKGKIVQVRRAPRMVHLQALEHADFTPAAPGDFVAMAPGARYVGVGIEAFAAGRSLYERFIEEPTFRFPGTRASRSRLTPFIPRSCT